MRWPGILGALALGLVLWGTLWAWPGSAVTQPIQFPHKTHIEQSLECTSCHERAEKDVVAGRPPTALCLSCHAGGDATGEIKKIQAFETGGEIPWRRVWRLPSHVFFSHRAHVTVAKVKCQTCHGPMETLTRPPSRPLRALTMNDCIACHEARSAPVEKAAQRAALSARARLTDCNTCHR
ncbi:MAG: cytochrome c3 family protein [Candidatus Rokubacteria bacterium]|nr:cytochrome c3 family protein [Candidatus Rokubacteria bacterium]